MQEKSEELKDLQAFNQDIIESMRGGLLTTDLEGRILVMNRSGAEITGCGLGLLRGEKIQDVFPGFWPVEVDEQGNPLAARKEIEFRTPTGAIRFPGTLHFSAAHRAEPDHRLRLQLPGPDGTEAAGAGSRHQGTHGRAWAAFPPPSPTKSASP